MLGIITIFKKSPLWWISQAITKSTLNLNVRVAYRFCPILSLLTMSQTADFRKMYTEQTACELFFPATSIWNISRRLKYYGILAQGKNCEARSPS
jgi:hypothetical protein